MQKYTYPDGHPGSRLRMPEQIAQDHAFIERRRREFRTTNRVVTYYSTGRILSDEISKAIDYFAITREVSA